MILLLGAKGYIAQAFIREIEKQDWHYYTWSRSEVDYTQFTYLRALIEDHKPDLVINCAAFIHNGLADACEDKKDETLLGNLAFPVNLVNACEVNSCKLMHISTGCLYNGDNGGKGWTEEDTPQLSFSGQCGTYVGSKELAERVVRQYQKHWICRVRLPFDEFDHPRNYLTKLMTYPKIVRASNSLSRRSDFVKACLHVYENRCPYGTYNMTNEGAISSEVITRFMKKTVCPGKEFIWWDEQEFQNTVARTPKSNCLLSIKKLQSTGFEMPYVADAIIDSLDAWVPEKH